MSDQKIKPAYSAKRRIQLLFGFVLIAVVASTGGWFFIAGKIDATAESFIEQQAAAGYTINCDNRDVRGFPFRFGLFCNSVSFSNPAQGLSFDAGSVRSAAQFYAPRDLIVELDSPAQFQAEGTKPVWMDWSQMRARILANDPLPQRVSITGRQVAIGLDDSKTNARAESVEAFARVVDSDLDIAGRTAAFEFVDTIAQLDGLPALGADFDLRIVDGEQLLLGTRQSLRGFDIQLNRLALLLNPDRGILASGPINVAENGLVNGTLSVRVIDVDAVSSTLTQALPDAAALITAFANGQPRKGENQDEIELEITINAGQARLGLIPIGTIPPL